MDQPGHRNYSRPINYSVSSPNNESTFPTIHAHQPHPPFSDTNDGPHHHQPLPPSKRSRSAPRARAQQPHQRPPSSASSSTHVKRPGRDSMISQDSTSTSVYPPSTVTSAFSGPDTPPSPLSPSAQLPAVAEHTLYIPSIRPDDISSRLRLLAVNSYFLPPAHAKPTPQELASPATASASATTTPSKSPVFRDLFKLKSSISTSPSERPQNHIPPPVPPSANPPVTRGPRLMVIRERLDDLDALATAAAAQSSSIEPSTSVIGLDVDPTTAVDVEYPEQRPNVQLQPPVETEQDAWKKELLQQAVGLSFASPPLSTSKSTSPQPHAPRKLAASPPLVRAPPPTTTITIAQQIAPPSLASQSIRSPASFMSEHHRGRQMNHNLTSAALPPPPRPSRDPTSAKLRKRSPAQTIASERSPPLPVPVPRSLPIGPVADVQQIPTLNVETASFASSLPPNAQRSHGEQSRFSLETILQVDARTSEEALSMSGRGGRISRKVSWEGAIHGALSPPPPWLSAATERGRWTPALSVEHDDERLSIAGSATARPSMTESLPSLPRQSMSSQASLASFQSATFGPRSTSRSKRGLFARARSTSPSRSSVSSKQSRSRSRGHTEDRPPTRSSGHYSETDANSMIVYVQPHTRAISSTAVSGSTPTTVFVADDSTPVPPLSLSATLDRKRGITNAPVFDTAHSNGSGIFGGFKRDRSPAPSMRSATLPSNTGSRPWDSVSSITVRPVQSDHGHGTKIVQPQPRTLEQWRETQVVQEEARRFEGMLVQHIEDEKDRIRKIAFGAHSRPGSAASTSSSPA